MKLVPEVVLASEDLVRQEQEVERFLDVATHVAAPPSRR